MIGANWPAGIVEAVTEALHQANCTEPGCKATSHAETDAKTALTAFLAASPRQATANPICFTLGNGDMITLCWSGELRMVIADTTSGELVLRDLTDTEAEELNEAVHDYGMRLP